MAACAALSAAGVGAAGVGAAGIGAAGIGAAGIGAAGIGAAGVSGAGAPGAAAAVARVARAYQGVTSQGPGGPGAQPWIARYNGPHNSDADVSSMAVSPDGSRVFVAGFSAGATTNSDYTTIAYHG